MKRSHEPGWELLAMHDPAQRRGVWFRDTPRAFELCAGREGDDEYIKLEAGTQITAVHLTRLSNIGNYARFAREDLAELPSNAELISKGKR